MKDNKNTRIEAKTPDFIASLFRPSQKKPNGRKAWSIDIETVWLPFFAATNTMGVTDVPKDSIGCPLRLAYNKDGSVRFSKNGRAIIRIDKAISQNVALVRENFVAGLQNYTAMVKTENEKAFNDMVAGCVKAGKPIAEADKANLERAMKAMVEAAIAEAEAQANETGKNETTETDKELVPA